MCSLQVNAMQTLRIISRMKTLETTLVLEILTYAHAPLTRASLIFRKLVRQLSVA